MLDADALGVLRVDHPPEEIRGGEPLFRCVPEELLDLRAHVLAETRSVERAHVGDEREVLDEVSVASLGLPQTGDGLAALSDHRLELGRLLLEAVVALLERPRDLAQDREQGGEEEEEREEERERDRLDRGVDASAIGA